MSHFDFNPTNLPITNGATYNHPVPESGSGTCAWCLRSIKLLGATTARHGWREGGNRQTGSYGNAYHLGGCHRDYAVEVSDRAVPFVLDALERAHAAAKAEIARIGAGGTLRWTTDVYTAADRPATLRLGSTAAGVTLTGSRTRMVGRGFSQTEMTLVSVDIEPAHAENRAWTVGAATVMAGSQTARVVPTWAEEAERQISVQERTLAATIEHASALQRLVAIGRGR